MKDNYYELEITTNSCDLFSEFLLENFCDAVEQKNNLLIVRSEDELDMVEFAVIEFAKALKDEINTKITIKKNQDWIKNYQNSIKSIKVGKFYIHPSWEESLDGFLNIKIDPALAFGSGHHESTNSCLLLLQEIIKKDDKVLDVGSGSGILAIASAKLGAEVSFCDTDEVAVDSSKRNFKQNCVEYEDFWVGSANRADKKYSVVIANIIADILILIKSDLKKSLKDDGTLIMSGILDIYRDKVIKSFSEFELINEIKKNEWYTLVMKRIKKETSE